MSLLIDKINSLVRIIAGGQNLSFGRKVSVKRIFAVDYVAGSLNGLSLFKPTLEASFPIGADPKGLRHFKNKQQTRR